MKKLVILGGAGVVGEALFHGLKSSYNILNLDRAIGQADASHQYVDATKYQELLEKIPEDTDVIINLLRMETSQAIEEVDTFDQMTDVFFKATYYTMHVANTKKIPKVIFASSNHVTDYMEENGLSKLGREITTEDYPYAKGLYGVLKLAAEQAGFIFSLNTELSVINIRIGSVPKEEELKAVEGNERLKRTLLSKVDLINLFTAAIESDRRFGTYYGVSDNPDKPWDLTNAIKELGYRPKQNTSELKSSGL
ncbi:NAD-dependent epimerase/dehydratase family protein [Gracilibacillus dipsosauri]|uniref:NAD-dependent epimerase/dehydratase family protein n=1 Tax=Gracilibacillus dipsosauri TaxID=178340 RepID=UPI00240A6689